MTEALCIAIDIKGFDEPSSKKDRLHAQVLVKELHKQLRKDFLKHMLINRDQGDTVFLVREKTEAWPRDEIGKALLNVMQNFEDAKQQLKSKCGCNAHASLDKLRCQVIAHSDKTTLVDVYKFSEHTGKAVWIPEHLLQNTIPTKSFVLYTESAGQDLDLEGLNVTSYEQKTDSGAIKAFVFSPPTMEKKPEKKISTLFKTLPYRLGLAKPVYRNLPINQP